MASGCALIFALLLSDSSLSFLNNTIFRNLQQHMNHPLENDLRGDSPNIPNCKHDCCRRIGTGLGGPMLGEVAQGDPISRTNFRVHTESSGTIGRITLHQR
jgi:hypothetical protein